MENEHWQAGSFPTETPGQTEWREALRTLTTFGEQALQEERKKSGGELVPVSADTGAKIWCGPHIGHSYPGPVRGKGSEAVCSPEGWWQEGKWA